MCRWYHFHASNQDLKSVAMNNRTKYFAKQAIWALPGPLSRVAVSLACAAGLLRPSYRAYHKLGRPTQVLSGSFEGMHYLPIAMGSAWLPKILGTYESELRPTFDRLMNEPCDVLIDVGAAEGYYAIGLAWKLKVPKVFTFDTDPISTSYLPRLAKLNGVTDSIRPGGFCHPADLNAHLREAVHPLVISDCEGGEVDLLDPESAPELRRSRIVVEVHDYFGSDTIGSTLRSRFASSHEIEVIPTTARTVADFPTGQGSCLTDEEVLASLSESRAPAAGWLVLRPIT